MMVVAGSATMSPMKPSNAPHIESDSSSTAGVSHIFLPIIFGITIDSMLSCTTPKTMTSSPSITQ